MTDYLRTPDTPADTLRDTLLGALVGLARSTSSEPKTENTDAVLNAGLRSAAPAVRQRKLRLLQAVFRLAAQHPDADVQLAIYRGLFAFSEDWDEELLDPVIAQTEKLCRR